MPARCMPQNARYIEQNLRDHLCSPLCLRLMSCQPQCVQAPVAPLRLGNELVVRLTHAVPVMHGEVACMSHVSWAAALQAAGTGTGMLTCYSLAACTGDKQGICKHCSPTADRTASYCLLWHQVWSHQSP